MQLNQKKLNSMEAVVEKKKRRPLRVVAISLAIIIAALVIAAGVYCYQCMNYWQADNQATLDAGFIETQVTTPDGSTINYAVGPDNGQALMLIHGQTGAWEDYERVLPELSKNWKVYAVDCYGHGQSEHDESMYYLQENGDDFIWFIDNIIAEKTVVSGHSSGALLASYVAAYGGSNVAGLVLEDPPVFSTEPDFFEKSFAYQDTYKNMHDYLNSNKQECWEAYYMRTCLWGKMYMPDAMEGLGNYAQWYYESNPGKPVQFIFMPEATNFMFLYSQDYDLVFGEHFFDYSWHSDIDHTVLMSDIEVPTVYLHIEEMYSDDGVLMAAATNEQADKAVSLIGDCELIRLSGNHDIHRFDSQAFVNTINMFQEQE